MAPPLFNDLGVDDDEAQASNTQAGKTGVCQWIQKLMSLGLLRAAWRPGAVVCAIRAVVRQRDVLLTEQASWVQRMQKALVQMNL